METNNTQTGAGNTTAARIVNHPHEANRFAIVSMYGDSLKNEHGAVCGFRTREDAQKHISTTGTGANTATQENRPTLTYIQEIYFDVCDRLRGLPITEIGYKTNKDMLEEFKWKLEHIEKDFKQLADIPERRANTKLNLTDGDYVLEDGGAWLQVKGFAVRIHATDEGVAVDIYRNGDEMADAIASAYAFDNETTNERNT